ncbi:MAG: hypothetical protein ABEJ46_02080, partial [Gemmatimonadota bacterium]
RGGRLLPGSSVRLRGREVTDADSGDLRRLRGRELGILFQQPGASLNPVHRAGRAVAEDWGLSLSSFVFPRNNLGHREVLAEHGFDCYRGRAPDRWYDDSPLRPLRVKR